MAKGWILVGGKKYILKQEQGDPGPQPTKEAPE